MSLSGRLQNCRTQARLTQQQVADVLHVPRESISMWEKGSRVPGLRQLEDLARLYSVSVEYLLGKEELIEGRFEREVLCRGLVNHPAVHMELSKWFEFLDEWSEIVESAGVTWNNAGKPPKKLDRGPDFTDSRAAPTLASEARAVYELGTDAIPDLYSFLDEQDILVCKANLGDWSDPAQPGISGAFHNHPKLGYCILVNAQNSLGRQAFTLAHEFAHALFHYNSRSLISIRKDSSPREYFADAFATHFLVPTRELNKLIDNWGWKNRIDPHKAIELAYVFRVSYVFMLYRLRNERHITEEQRAQWATLSPGALAHQLGLDPEVFHKPGTEALNMNRYPASVLQTVRDLIRQDELFVSQAADLLDVSQAQIQSLLLSEPAQATESEQKEACEFAF
ncbi:MAG TPA: XRE family transcriptional regulator [Candidatus Obscuribacterales bacterium]